jgi:heme/copper-type cytochrome/quinol oxidase subunit 2
MRPHFTTRRGFIAACGFGVVGLYGLWAGYGAAPLPFVGHAGESPHAAKDPGHGGHGGAPSRLSPDEFRRLAEDFAARHASGAGARANPRALAEMRPDRGDPHAGHGAAHGMAHAAAGEDDDVYLMAYQWGFTPEALRLEANRPYRLRMMAVDVSHGAAIRLGPGSRIVRLRANTLVEQTATFSRPGDYLVYCTVYCGPGHARMKGRLIVA